MRSVIRALGTLIAVLLVAAGPVLAIPAARSSAAAELQQRSSRTAAASSHTLAISITGMSPRTATQNDTVTVRGTLANHTGSAVSAVTVQAYTSTELFSTRSAMADFTDTAAAVSVTNTGAYQYGLQQAGQPAVTGAIPNGATVAWSVSFDGAFFVQFGVYPIQVQASVPGTQTLVAARTFLPFWPTDGSSPQPTRLQVAWIWPLTDMPQQGACGTTLASTELSGSVSAGGRLSALLDAGATWSQKDHLTWNVDPALLSDVSVMTRKYHASGSADCTGRSLVQPSSAAVTWLGKLASSTAGQSAFLTSYANVDVAALSHAGLDENIRSAYQVGRTVAGQILPNTFGKTGTGTGNGAVLRAAWPAGGLADRGVLTSLTSDAGVGTLVLASGQARARPTAQGSDALSRTTSDTGKSVSVLLADSRMTTLLGAASPRASASQQFALIQDFLAQTAMITNEAPNLGRTLVVAPPAGWDPSPAEANALLSVTHTQAPWLRSVTVSALAGQAAHVPSRPLKAKQVSRAELSASYLDQVREAGNSASLFKNLLFQPAASVTSRLAAAVAATASSAWRGAGAPGGAQAIRQLSGYLSDSEQKVKLLVGKKILLAGTSGEIPVSVLNGLPWPVQVQVVATAPPGSQLQVGSLAKPLTVIGGTSGTGKMPMHSAAIGTTTVRLQLVTQDGSPLTWTSQPLSVEVTRFGRSLLIIIGAALGILVLTSAYRLHRKRNAGGGRGGSPDETADAGGAG